jgi:small conductance mechanosensitive channel
VDLGDVSHWARGHGLQTLLIAIGSVLIARFVHWASWRYRQRLDRESRVQIEHGGAASERIKQARTLTQVVEWGVVAIVYFVATLLIMSRLGIPLTSLIAPATVAGAAIGFGAQQLVQDLLAGFFLISERQFGVGDAVRMSLPGQSEGVSGTVEELTLRVTKLRTDQGELVFVPNGTLRQVTNSSKEWSRVVVDVPIGVDQDLDKATRALREMVAEMGRDPAWTDILLDEPIVAGVETIEVGYLQLRLIARTLPGKQFDVGSELRLRAARTLQEQGISPPPAISIHRPDG